MDSVPSVAVIVLNHNGLQHLESCFQSLLEMDYPRDHWSLWVVDNGSTDGSVPWLEARRDANLLTNAHNRGFSAGCNQGAAAAVGVDLLCFLNNDTRVDPGFLRELVRPIQQGDVAATTGKMLSWDGQHIDSAGGGMNFHGIGIAKSHRDLAGPEHDVEGPTLFACGGAMAIDRRVFAEVGGFDEAFFAYYEDVDLGWRLWVLGHEVGYVPGAVCYHRHSSTSDAFPKESIRRLQVRNPILSCVKNYDDENLKRVLPVAFALALRRMHMVSGVRGDDSFRIEALASRPTHGLARWKERLRGRVLDTVPVRREAVADLLGLNDLLENWGHWMERRQRVQQARKRSDAEILSLFDDPLWCIERDTDYADLQAGLQQFFEIDRIFDEAGSR